MKMLFIFNKDEKMVLSEPHSKTDDWLARLQNSGCRITTPRRAIVETIATSQKALDVVAIFDQARNNCRGLGLVTVYRTLEKLEALHLVQRVHQADGCHMYLTATQGHQHLLICRSCGQVAYFSGDDLSGLFEFVARRTGFDVQEHWLQLFGLCPQCSQK
jgi:Fur family transcriptional regulator, ferric uptake regulator